MPNKNYYLIQLALNLRKHRKASGMSQQMLSGMTGIPRMRIQQYESLSILEDIKKIAETIDVSVDDLIGSEETVTSLINNYGGNNNGILHRLQSDEFAKFFKLSDTDVIREFVEKFKKDTLEVIFENAANRAECSPDKVKKQYYGGNMSTAVFSALANEIGFELNYAELIPYLLMYKDINDKQTAFLKYLLKYTNFNIEKHRVKK